MAGDIVRYWKVQVFQGITHEHGGHFANNVVAAGDRARAGVEFGNHAERPAEATADIPVDDRNENKPGVLVRLSGLFARRGFNIESLSVARSEKPGISRTTFVVNGEDSTIEQVQKQLQKLINVIKVIDHTDTAFVDRELMMLKVRVGSPEARVEIREIAQDFRARIVDVDRNALIFEVTGDEGKMNAFIDQMQVFGIIELVRTGRVALPRSARDPRVKERRPTPRAA